MDQVTEKPEMIGNETEGVAGSIDNSLENDDIADGGSFGPAWERIGKKRKISAKSLANLIPARKGEPSRNPKGSHLSLEKKMELRAIREVRNVAREAVLNTKEYLQAKAPSAARRVYRLSREAGKDDGVLLKANQDILDRAGVIGPKAAGVAVGVQINFADDRYK